MADMIDHLSVGVSDLERGRRFYDAAMAPLGYRRVNDKVRSSGYGPDENQDDFYIVLVSSEGSTVPGSHVALKANTRAAVDGFHSAALAEGGADDGSPGIWKRYHENYYAAYILDPDGNRIEAVCHTPE
jgi:catechol 2,3-dioxygenase-like lactoylglutathione lyase family enzyme